MKVHQHCSKNPSLDLLLLKSLVNLGFSSALVENNCAQLQANAKAAANKITNKNVMTHLDVKPQNTPRLITIPTPRRSEHVVIHPLLDGFRVVGVGYGKWGPEVVFVLVGGAPAAVLVVAVAAAIVGVAVALDDEDAPLVKNRRNDRVGGFERRRDQVFREVPRRRRRRRERRCCILSSAPRRSFPRRPPESRRQGEAACYVAMLLVTHQHEEQAAFRPQKGHSRHCPGFRTPSLPPPTTVATFLVSLFLFLLLVLAVIPQHR